MSRKEYSLGTFYRHYIESSKIHHIFLESYVKRPQTALVTLHPVYYRITPIQKNFQLILNQKLGVVPIIERLCALFSFVPFAPLR